MEYKTSDGWDLDNIDPLYEAVEAMEDLNKILYELNNCRRTRSLVEMRDSLVRCAKEIIRACEQISDKDKVVEKEVNENVL